jgi:lysophosphatidic acid acyltransferase/lysophosphatidylinositol acyltransferase
VECWAGSTIRLHGDKKLHDTVGKERAIILMNHTYEIDGVMTWVVCDHVGILGNSKVMAKKALKFAPIVGWTWYFAEILFLDRDWNKDQIMLSRQFDTLLEWPDPFWVCSWFATVPGFSE